MPQEPKRRHSIARKGKRRSSIKLTVTKSVVCKNCQATYISHTICGNCGYYSGKKIANVQSENKTKAENPA